MKKLLVGLTLCLTSSLSYSFAEGASVISTTTQGNFDECKDSWGGFVVSCEKEKVQIPQIISKDQTIKLIFLEKRKGYYTHIDVDSITFNPKKNSCTIRSFYSGGSRALYTKDCKILKN